MATDHKNPIAFSVASCLNTCTSVRAETLITPFSYQGDRMFASQLRTRSGCASCTVPHRNFATCRVPSLSRSAATLVSFPSLISHVARRHAAVDRRELTCHA